MPLNLIPLFNQQPLLKESIPNNPLPLFLIILPLLSVLGLLVIYFAVIHVKDRRQAFIDQYRFSAHQFARVHIEYPHLSDTHLAMVARGLKTFFSAHLQHPSTVHAMPSKAMDALWHAFILDTRAYQSFCQQAFGHYFHHIPSTGMDEAHNNEAALERMWRYACRVQGLNPVLASSLPAVFALDTALGIPNGMTHDANDLAKLAKAYDARHASGGDGGGGVGGSGSGGCADGGSGCGGGCGGGGCGG